MNIKEDDFMLKISSFMYCEQAQVDNETGQLEISRPLYGIVTESIPTRFSFSIVFAMVGLDPSEDHSLHLIFKSPDDENIIVTDRIPVGFNDREVVSEESHGINLSVDFRNVLLEKEGLYKTEIYINDDLVDYFPIPVMKGSE
jgi:hypothetical protein